MPTELKVFPNTGHQYFTLELEKLCPNRDPGMLNTLVMKHINDPWQVWDPYPWVRYQYDESTDLGQSSGTTTSVPVIKIAIETNMSIPRNGLLWEIDSKLEKKGTDEFLFPYASDDAAQITENLGEERAVPLFSLPNKEGRELPVDLHVVFAKPAGNDPIDVDLVVDLGNTRTAALLLETRGAPDKDQWPFSRRVKVLRVTPPGVQYDKVDKDCEIIPSWLLMHRTTFAALEPNLNFSQLFDMYDSYEDASGKKLYRRQRYLPRSFIEISPAMVGGGKSNKGVAKRLSDLALMSGRYYFSSPKRYVWDDMQTGSQGGVFWMQVKNPSDPDKRGDMLTELGGMVRVYMDPESHDWDIEHPPEDEDFLRRYPERPPSYPRRDSVCWFALSLIEAAYRQINSRKYLDSTGYAELPRRLRHIMVTYPAAWNHEVKESFLAQWRRAINLFTVTHFDTDRHAPVTQGGARPVLVDANVNEAICSQLPIMYSDISNLMNKPDEWFQLYGDADDKVVVMNLDIGGGTTDLTVIRYQGAPHGSMQPHLLFQDGRSTAGDELVKKIIEKLLLPAWIKVGDQGQYKNFPEAKAWVLNLLKDPSNHEIAQVEPLAHSRLARITRLLFIPLVNELLSGMVGMEGNPEGRLEPLDLEQFGAIYETPVKELNDMASAIIRAKCRNGGAWKGQVFPLKGVRLSIPAAQIDECIEDVFGAFCKSLGRVAAHFRCHLVIVTGKPSELPKLRQLITEAFPILPQRIIHARNFPAGRWYPFGSFGVGDTESGRIMDAKSCTVVGAALYLDSLKNPHLTRFLTIEDTAGEMKGRYFWGVVPLQGNAREFYDQRNLLFTPSEYSKAVQQGNRLTLEKDFELTINDCRIGRQVIRVENVRAEPVYELCFTPERGHNVMIQTPVRAKVRLRWVLEKGRGESLELVSVKPLEALDEMQNVRVRLRLNTLYESSFWLDDPRFELGERAA
ncbi:MAG TPA: virulence factor SrfB, partial [Verrucomicrobiae bacterium]|nr:virulence factor SrfB [Verrucomicrobiae bacterium]